MKKLVSFVAVLLAISTLTFASGGGEKAPAGASTGGAAAVAAGPAKYIFVFIGDGTSIPQRNAAELYLASINASVDLGNATNRAAGKFPSGNGVADFAPTVQRMLMSTFPGQGFSSTYSSNSLITDSSSSGTAIATGKKTRDGVVGMDPTGTEKYVSMAKLAKAKGLKVGIVSSVSLDHATPASFYASVPNRNSFYDITSQIPASGFNFFGGGGFLAAQDKKATKPIKEVLEEGGYKVYNTRADFDKIKAGDDKVITSNFVLDGDNALPYAIDQKPGEIRYEDFVAKAIEVLDNDKGFFLMAECGKVDWSAHANDAVATVNEVLTLDKGVKVAYEFYQKHPTETLIVVTGDHETGGMTMGFAGTKYDAFLKRLSGQKGSYIDFNTKFAEFKAANPTANIEAFLPLVESYFGLKRYSQSEFTALEATAKTGDQAAFEKLGLALRDYEIADLTKALAMSYNTNRPTSTDEYYLSYGSYEPITVTLTHILNNKAGVGWTTFSHTGLPTPVSVIGVGYELFNGYYDNTDIFKKVVQIGQLQ
ncbi:alkaline phosphatase [Treponema primitia]|uniref:alkaline phosphatase n=1 Tax=Treponema primitia TaxID=88058 RepID=UPI00397F0888